MNKIFIILLILIIYTNNSWASSIFVIGQDSQSIVDYVESSNTHILPDGFMVYTAINDLRGLDVGVDHGAGVNNADYLLKKYPFFKTVQMGLYMRHMLTATTKGYLDENIKKLSKWVSQCDCNVYLRIGYEFDNVDNEYKPQQYIKAYHYIVDKLRSYGVKNIEFIWHTIAWKEDDWPEYDPMKYYPGDDYVDWIGISYFDSDRTEEREKVANLAHTLKKPLMIAESAPFRKYSIQEKKEWFKKFFQYTKQNNIRFISYINVNWDELEMFKKEKWGDSRIQNQKDLIEYFENNIK